MDVTDSLDLDSFKEYADYYSGYFEGYSGKLRDGTEVMILARSYEDERENRERDIQRLFDIWAECDHPNILSLIGKATFRGDLVIVYEHPRLDIYDYLRKHPMELPDRYWLVAQICNGVAYLQKKGIMNGALDPSSTFVSSNGVAQIELGFYARSYLDPVGIDGTDYEPWYPAPEVDRLRPEITFATEVFELGMTIILNNPFDHRKKTFYDALLKGEHLSEWKTAFEIPSDKAGNMCWDILCKCLSLNPDDRPTPSEVSAVMRTVCQLSGWLTPYLLGWEGSNLMGAIETVVQGSFRLVVGEDTSIHDLVAHFERRGLVNYTDLVNSVDRTAVESVADTALANVYRVEIRSNQAVAVKCVKHNTTYKRLKRAARELDCWSSHMHENILPIIGFATIGADLAMVSPWMGNGCVTDYVVRNPNCNRLALCVQLAGVVAYLHENNAVHGDIKGPNVLVSDTGTVQVTDFGVSIADHQEIEFSMTSSGRGTQRWQAPEVLTAQTDSTREADVYALAMTMIEIYTGEPPYGSKNWAQIMIPVINNRLRPPRPVRLPIDEVGNGVWDLMQYCWLADPTERPPSNRVHEWLQYYLSLRTNTQVYYR